MTSNPMSRRPSRARVRQLEQGPDGHVLDAPDGNVWIMKGFQLGLDPKTSYEEFMAKGPANFKKLPPGWKARVVTLAQDNLEVPENGIAHIMSDEFFKRLRQNWSGHEQLQAVGEVLWVLRPFIPAAEHPRCARNDCLRHLSYPLRRQILTVAIDFRSGHLRRC